MSKTTYLSRQVRLAWEAGHEVLVTSLTRASASEVAGRNLPINPHRIGTLHSHCLRALEGGFSGVATDPKLIAEWNLEHPELALTGGLRDIDEDNASPFDGKEPGDLLYNAMNCYRARLTPEELWKEDVRSFARQWTGWKKANDLIDFTDMLEIARDSIPIAPGNPDVIFADEAQDFSALEMAVLHQWGVKAGRLIVVGDAYQCLYNWRGSDPDVFFAGDAREERVLRQSYRVPQEVHHAAMTWLEDSPNYQPIEYYPTDVEGLVDSLSATWKQPQEMMPVLEESLAQDKTVMIIASCGYMLTPTLKLLREQGIPFHNEHSRKNGAWNPLQRRGSKMTASDRLRAFLKLGEEGHWTRDDLLAWLPVMKCSEFLPGKKGFQKIKAGLESWGNEEIPYWLVEATVGEVAAEAGMAQDYSWYTEHLQAARRDAASFPAAIARRCGVDALVETPRVTVGTIHSVKGGEADVVVIAPDLSLQGVDSWRSGDEGKASIYRLFYVALTRAKESVYVMNPADRKGAMRLL